MKRYIETTGNEHGQLEPATWDEKNNPVTYGTEEEAEIEVTDHMLGVWEAIKAGHMLFDTVRQPSIHECVIDPDGSITIGDEHKTTWTKKELEEMRA